MRLIDADEFEKFIEQKYKDGESTDDIKDQMLFDLSYQPTAYDVDAVVEELEKEREHIKKKYDNPEDAFEVITYGNMLNVSTKAIDIVRKGGV